MAAIGQNFTSSMTGNVPKAILCVRDMKESGGALGYAQLYKAALAQAANDQAKKDYMAAEAKTAIQGVGNVQTLITELVLSNGVKGTVTTYQNEAFQSALSGSHYLALEVQYNPNTISMDTQAGVQVQYGGGNLGNASNNQLVQIDQPVATTMSFQLVFDAMNVEDAFMLENLSPTVGNVQAAIQNKLKGTTGYSVQPQMEGLVALLTQDMTRQVLFFWSEMCFQGEVVSVSSHYTMFNKNGSPIRGTVDISIRQDDESDERKQYWNDAFTAAFGAEDVTATVGTVSSLTQYTNNSLLNLNL